MKPILAAFFLMLTSLSAFGGEWHSAGNAPVMPHKPTGIASYKCTLTGYTQVGKKAYRFSQERVIEDREFRGLMNSAFMILENTGDPGMDGQSLSLNFRQGFDGEEILQLSVGLRVDGKASATSMFEAPRSAKNIRGQSSMTIKKPARGGASWVRVQADCLDLN